MKNNISEKKINFELHPKNDKKKFFLEYTETYIQKKCKYFKQLKEMT